MEHHKSAMVHRCICTEMCHLKKCTMVHLVHLGIFLNIRCLGKSNGAFGHFRAKSSEMKMHRVHFGHLGRFLTYERLWTKFRWCIWAFAQNLSAEKMHHGAFGAFGLAAPIFGIFEKMLQVWPPLLRVTRPWLYRKNLHAAARRRFQEDF